MIECRVWKWGGGVVTYVAMAHRLLWRWVLEKERDSPHCIFPFPFQPHILLATVYNISRKSGGTSFHFVCKVKKPLNCGLPAPAWELSSQSTTILLLAKITDAFTQMAVFYYAECGWNISQKHLLTGGICPMNTCWQEEYVS